MLDLSNVIPVRPRLAHLALVFAMTLALALSLLTAPAGHAVGQSGVAGIETQSDLATDLGAYESAHCDCAQAAPVVTNSKTPFVDVTFTAYIVAHDRALATIAAQPQPEPPRA